MSTFEVPTDIGEDVRNLHIKDLLSIPGDAMEALKNVRDSELGKSLLNATGNILRRSMNGIAGFASRAVSKTGSTIAAARDFAVSIPERIEDIRVGLEEASIANQVTSAAETERELLDTQAANREYHMDFYGNKVYTEPSAFEKFPTIAMLAWSALKQKGNSEVFNQDVDYMQRKGTVNEYKVVKYIHDKVTETMKMRKYEDDDFYVHGASEYLRGIKSHAEYEISNNIERINRGRRRGDMDNLTSGIQLAKVNAQRDFIGKEDGIGAEYFYMHEAGSYQHRELVMVSAIKLLIADNALSGTVEYDNDLNKYVYYQKDRRNNYVLDGTINSSRIVGESKRVA